MAANTSFNTAALNQGIMDFVLSPEQGLQILVGSFQGNATAAPTTSKIRGGWIASVAHTSTGRYRVQMALPLPNDLAVYAPPGLVGEACCWVASESITTAPASVFTTGVSAFDTTTNLNTFDIFCYVAGSLTDVAATDRVFFQLAWKNTSVLP